MLRVVKKVVTTKEYEEGSWPSNIEHVWVVYSASGLDGTYIKAMFTNRVLAEKFFRLWRSEKGTAVTLDKPFENAFMDTNGRRISLCSVPIEDLRFGKE